MSIIKTDEQKMGSRTKHLQGEATRGTRQKIWVDIFHKLTYLKNNLKWTKEVLTK